MGIKQTLGAIVLAGIIGLPGCTKIEAPLAKGVEDSANEKIKNVNDKIQAKLIEKELGETEYWAIVHQLLLDEGISTGSYRLGFDLLSEMPIKMYTGLNKLYIALKDNDLSAEAQEDVKQYSELERQTYSYLEETLDYQPISTLEYKRLIRDYLREQTDLPNLTAEERQEVTINSIILHLALEKFNIYEGNKLILKNKRD